MRNLKISTQLAIGFVMLLVFLTGTSVFSIFQQSQLASLTEKQFRHPFTVTNAIARADANIVRMMRLMKDIALTEGDVQRYTTELDALEPKVLADLALAKERFLGDQADFDALIGKFKEW